MPNESITQIIDFWFRGVDDSTPINRGNEPYRSWFQKNDDFDHTIKERFESLVIKAGQNQLSDWENTIDGCLALLLLLDQFPRNIFRNTPNAFAYDHLASALVQRILEKQQDKDTSCIRRVFIYMPLMHSENLSEQELGVSQFEKLVEDSEQCCSKITHYFKYNLDFMRRHHEIIARFGRFPHRNAILARESTKEEQEFLTQPGSGF